MDYQDDFAKWMRREASDDFCKGGLHRVEDAYRDGWRAGWVARQSTEEEPDNSHQHTHAASPDWDICPNCHKPAGVQVTHVTNMACLHCHYRWADKRQHA